MGYNVNKDVDTELSWIELMDQIAVNVRDMSNIDLNEFAFAYCLGYAEAKGVDLTGKSPFEAWDLLGFGKGD